MAVALLVTWGVFGGLLSMLTGTRAVHCARAQAVRCEAFNPLIAATLATDPVAEGDHRVLLLSSVGDALETDR